MQQPRNFSMSGAVDLGARQAAAKRRDQAAQPPAGRSAFVIDVTDETFNVDVVGRSQSVPVIMDLWAEWCEPCKQLGPVLEKLAEEAAGDWILAKVDVDANPQLSQALQVQSIPMVVAVIGGQLVDGFLGALPEAEVRQWIGQILQVASQIGMPPGERAAADGNGAGETDDADLPTGAEAAAGTAGAAGAGAGMRTGGPGGGYGADMLADPRLKAAQDAMDSGDMNGAANALSQVLDDTPGHPIAKAWLAQVELIRRVTSYDQSKVMRAAGEHPDDPEAQIQAADVELADGQIEESFDRLLGAFQRLADQDRDKIRVHLLGLFDILPPKDPRVSKARGRLSSLLF
jgi:putative thioredoxin